MIVLVRSWCRSWNVSIHNINPSPIIIFFSHRMCGMFQALSQFYNNYDTVVAFLVPALLIVMLNTVTAYTAWKLAGVRRTMTNHKRYDAAQSVNREISCVFRWMFWSSKNLSLISRHITYKVHAILFIRLEKRHRMDLIWAFHRKCVETWSRLKTWHEPQAADIWTAITAPNNHVPKQVRLIFKTNPKW